MGELRACLLPAWALRALLGAGAANRDHVLELAARELTPPRPQPLGPIYTRVPGAPLVREGDPAPDDVDRLLGQDAAVPLRRARATWRLVEAVAAGMASATLRTTAGRPTGLAPLGLAIPEPDDLVVGSWTLAQASGMPSLSTWLEDAVTQVPAGSSAPDVVVFWEAGKDD